MLPDPIAQPRDAHAVRRLVLDALQRSQGIGHVPQWHRDIDDPHTYRRQGYAMFVIDDPDAPGEILALSLIHI